MSTTYEVLNQCDRRPLQILDIEVAPNMVMVGLLEPEKGAVQIITATDAPFDQVEINQLKGIVKRDTLVGFNIRGYDQYILAAALNGLPASDIYRLSVDLIEGGDNRHWAVANNHKVKVPSSIEILDLMQLVPGKVGLKTMGARISAKSLQELPFDPHQSVDKVSLPEIECYLRNDLQLTKVLLERLQGEITLRHTLEALFGVQLVSDGAPKVAEKIVLSEYTKRHQVDLTDIKRSAGLNSNLVHRYVLPNWLKPKTESLRAIAGRYTEDAFRFINGTIQNPVHAKVKLGQRSYTIGMGGLHSMDGRGLWQADEDNELIDADVHSYYPSIILQESYTPRQLNRAAFLEVYRGIRDRRIRAKQEGSIGESNSLKLVLNSLFGMTNEKFSVFYDPSVMMDVTITGQLGLLLLIESLETAGITVVSANTDGVTVQLRSDKKEAYTAICEAWQLATGFGLEFAHFKCIARRDVNNYIAIKTDGTIKSKGALIAPTAPEGDLIHALNGEIMKMAVVAYLAQDTPIEETIRHCQDPRLFVFNKIASRGAQFGEVHLGKNVRWYYSTEDLPEIRTATENKAGALVTIARGSRAAMELPEALPADLDRDRYTKEAQALLESILLPVNPHTTTVANKLHEAGVPIRAVYDDETPQGHRATPCEEDVSGARSLAITTGKKTEILALCVGDSLPEVGALVTTNGTPMYRLVKCSPDRINTVAEWAGQHGVEFVYGKPIIVHGRHQGADYSISGEIDDLAKLLGGCVNGAPRAEDPTLGITNKQLTNTEFVKHMFHPCAEGTAPLVCAFAGDPGDARGGKWMAKPAHFDRRLPKALQADNLNNYLVVSAFRPDSGNQWNRNKSNFAALHMVMLDDLGTGQGAKHPLDRLKLTPTALIETSPNNFQAYLKLSQPISDLATAEALINALIHQGLLSERDPGMSGVNRYGRLPNGINGKPKYGGWQVRLDQWNPELSYTLENIVEAFSLHLNVEDEKDYDGHSHVQPDQDPYLKVFEELDLVCGGVRQTGKAQIVDLLCPWIDEHTDKKPGGTAYFIGGGFKCHHGHCDHRHFSDVKQWLSENHQIDTRALDSELIASAFTRSVEFTEEDGVASIALAQHEDLRGTINPFLEPFPGVMQLTVAETLETAPKPQPELTTLAILIAMSAGCSGHYYLPYNGMRLNLYGCGVAGTGEGKDMPRRVAMDLAREAGSLLQGKAASGQGLEDQLRDYVGFFMEVDEIGHLFEAVNNSHNSSHLIELAGNMLKLFSASSHVYNTRAKAMTRGVSPPREIHHPVFNLLGFSTPEVLGRAVKVKNIEDGILGRVIFAFGRDGVGTHLQPRKFALPDEAREKAAEIRAVFADFSDDGHNDVEIKVSSATHLAITKISAHFDSKSRSESAAFAKALCQRSTEKLLRISGVLAVWDNPRNPEVTLAHLDWAKATVESSDAEMISFVDKFMHPSLIQEHAARVVKIIKRILRKELKVQRASEQALVDKGQVPYRAVLQHSKLDAGDMIKAIEHLGATDEVRVVNSAVSGNVSKVRCLMLAS